MFDDPKKNLKRIEEELWAAEQEEEEALPQEELPEDSFSFEDSPWLRDTWAELREEEETPVRNFANGYGRRQRNDAVDFHRTAYADEEMDEAAAVFVEKQKRIKKEKKQRKKTRGTGCLSVIIFLELLGIAGIGWWWYRWLT